MDNYLRERAAGNGAKLYNGLFLRMEQKEGEEGPFTIQFSNYEDGGKARASDTWSSPSPCTRPAVLIKPMTAESSRHQRRAEWLTMAARSSSGSELSSVLLAACVSRQRPGLRSESSCVVCRWASRTASRWMRSSAPTAPTAASPRRSAPATMTTPLPSRCCPRRCGALSYSLFAARQLGALQRDLT